MTRFILSFFIYVVFFYILIEESSLLEYTTHFAIQATQFSIETVGLSATLVDNAFHFDNATMLVTSECNGLKPILLFVSVLLAYPAKFSVKVLWVVLSIPVLQLINILRITFLAWILRYHLEWFDFFHDYITPFFIVTSALYLFYIYTNIANTSSRSDA